MNDLYPDGWRVIALAVKDANGWRCSICNLQCRRPGEMWLGWEYELTCAHISQDYYAPVVQVAALCRKCHLVYDAPLVWVARRRMDRWRQRAAGQLSLFSLK